MTNHTAYKLAILKSKCQIGRVGNTDSLGNFWAVEAHAHTNVLVVIQGLYTYLFLHFFDNQIGNVRVFLEIGTVSERIIGGPTFTIISTSAIETTRKIVYQGNTFFVLFVHCWLCYQKFNKKSINNNVIFVMITSGVFY